jgi:hypothetical protein
MAGLFALAMLLGALSPSVSAQTVPRETRQIEQSATGHSWLRTCESEATYSQCVSLIIGIDAGHAQMTAANPGIQYSYCPGNQTMGQMTWVAINYVRRNTHMRHMRFTDLVLMSWMEAWPCRRY